MSSPVIRGLRPGISTPPIACVSSPRRCVRPHLWNLDRADRSDFLRYFYRRFEDARSNASNKTRWR